MIIPFVALIAIVAVVMFFMLFAKKKENKGEGLGDPKAGQRH
jgi:hypothetical protein